MDIQSTVVAVLAVVLVVAVVLIVLLLGLTGPPSSWHDDDFEAKGP